MSESDSSGSLTRSRGGLKKNTLLSSNIPNDDDSSHLPTDSPPETPGLKRKSKLGMALTKPKISVNVSNNFTDLAKKTSQKRSGL